MPDEQNNTGLPHSAETAGEVESDADPQSLEEQLRQLAPAHTFWHVEETGMPAPVRAVVKALKGLGAKDAPAVPDMVSAAWTTPDGIWHIRFADCCNGGYHLKISGPDTDVSRTHVTTEQALELCLAVGAISTTRPAGVLAD